MRITKHMLKYKELCKRMANKPTEKQVRAYKKAYKKWMMDKRTPKPVPAYAWMEQVYFGHKL